MASDCNLNGWATLIGQQPQPHKTLNGPHGPNLFQDPASALAQYQQTLAGGTGQRNGVRGGGNFDIDLGVSKRWIMPYNEKHSLQFRWETFNLTNSVRFDIFYLSLTFASPTAFGTYSGTLNSPRQMQFALRYEF